MGVQTNLSKGIAGTLMQMVNDSGEVGEWLHSRPLIGKRGDGRAKVCFPNIWVFRSYLAYRLPVRSCFRWLEYVVLVWASILEQYWLMLNFGSNGGD